MSIFHRYDTLQKTLFGINNFNEMRIANPQAALAVYRQDQKSHHDQSIASDLTRGLLRKIFRETVLESSKQVQYRR